MREVLQSTAHAMKRRQALKLAAGTATAGITMTAGCLGDDDEVDGDLTTLPWLLTDGEINIPIFLAQEEAWEEYGINLEVELTSYERVSRALYEDGEANMTGNNLINFYQYIDDGEDIVMFGGNELETNGVWTRAGSDIDSPADFDEDTRVGVPFWNSGTTTFARAAIMEEYGIDIREDTDSISSEPPVLWELLTEQEDLDAIINFTLFAFKGLANPDVVDRIFAPEDWFEEEYGVSPFVTQFAARREWLEQPENAQTALNFMKGWDAANEDFAANVDQYMDQYGRFAGLDSDAEVDVVRDKFANDEVTIKSDEWDEQRVDTQFDILQLWEDNGLISEAPSREQGITHAELEELAEE